MREVLILTGLCLLLALLSLGVLIWAVLGGQVYGLDGLLLILTSLLLAVVFFGVTLSLLRSEPLRALWLQPQENPADEEKQKSPPAQAS